jgi:hypothetical protein
MFHWQRARLLAFALAVFAIAGGWAYATDKQAVSITLQSITPTPVRVPVLGEGGLGRHPVTFTNTIFYNVVFQVTNSCSVPVSLNSSGLTSNSTNLSLPFGMFGNCNVPPFTNALLSFLLSPRTRAESFRYTVFEPAGFYERVEFAAGRLKSNLSGKTKYNSFRPDVMWSAAYEISSPVIDKWPDLPSATESLLPKPPKDSLEYVLGNNWSTEGETNVLELQLPFEMRYSDLPHL